LESLWRKLYQRCFRSAAITAWKIRSQTAHKNGSIMKPNETSLAARFDLFVNYFIPPSIAAERELRNRAHVFLISHLLGPFIGSVVPIALYFLVPNPGYEVEILAISIVSFWLFPFALRMGAPYNPLALISVQNLTFCILWSCYFYGGVTSPTLPWVLTIPLLAFFYLGSSASLRLTVMAMFGANLVCFSIFYSNGWGIKGDLPIVAMQGLGIVSTIAAAIYVAMMALYYAKILASQTELEGEMRQHMATASELRRATEEAERAGAAKAEFLAKMSHELRTPLNAVIGYSQILLEDAEDESDTGSVSDLNKIHDAGQYLLKMVNEVLDLSKIEAGKMELHIEKTNLAALLADIARSFQPAASRNCNQVVWEISSNIGHSWCDATKFRSMLGHLLDNAVKFTQDGKIGLLAERKTVDADDMLLVHVTDTGIGIAANQIDGLFEKFTVADDSSTSKYGGTGLGLALSQKLCKLMGGEILIHSEVGIGSRFTVRMPLAGAPAHMRERSRPAAASHDHSAATLVPALEVLHPSLQPAGIEADA